MRRILLALIFVVSCVSASAQTVVNCPSGFASSGSCGVSLIGGGGQPFMLAGSPNGFPPSLVGSQVRLIPSSANHTALNMNFTTKVNVQAFDVTYTFIPNGWNISFVLQNNTNSNAGGIGSGFSSGAGCEASFFQGFPSGGGTQSTNNLWAMELDSNNPLPAGSGGPYTHSSVQTYTTNQSPCNPRLGTPTVPYVAQTKISIAPVNLNLTTGSNCSGQVNNGCSTSTGHVYSVSIHYDGTTATMSMFDVTGGGACPGASCFTNSWTVNIPSLVGGNTAWMGLAGGTNDPTPYPLLLNSLVYTVNPSTPTAATPVFSPAPGTYTSTQTVTVTDSTPSSTIRCTTNGTTPTGTSPVYTGPFSVPVTTTIQCIALASGFLNSAVGGGTYTINVIAPTFSPPAGTYTSVQSVAITSATSGASIYYTVDGTTPTFPISGTTTLYSGPISVAGTQTVKAIGVKSGLTTSGVSSALYTISLPPAATPTFAPLAGTYTLPQSVAISSPSSANQVTMVQYSARSGFNKSGSSFTPGFNLPFAVTQGNTVIVALFLETAPGSPLALTNGSGVPVAFNLIASRLSGGSGLYIYSASNVPKGQISIRPTTTPVTNGASVIMEFQGLVSASLLNSSSFGSGTATPLSTGSVTPTAGSYLLSLLGQDSISTIPAVSGLSLTHVGPGNVLGNPGLPSVSFIQVAQGWGNAGIAYSATWSNLTSGANSIGVILALNSLGGTFNTNAVMGQYTGGTNGSSPFSVLANPTQNAVQSQDAIFGAVTTGSFTTNNPVASGNTGVIYVWEGNAATLPTIPPDSLGNVWALAGSTTAISGLYAFTSLFSNSGTATITINAGSGVNFGATFAEYSGVGSVDVVSSGSSTGAGTIVPTTGATITTTSTDLMIDGIALYFPDFASGTSGFNLSASAESFTPGVGNSSMNTFDVVAPAGTYTMPVYYEVDVINPPIYATSVEQLIVALRTTGVATNYFGVVPPSLSASNIYYTTDGSTPTTSSTVYSGPLSITSTTTVKAIAVAPAHSQSPVGTAVYTITSIPTLPAPNFAPPAGTYSGTQPVVISAASGATICYRVNGTPGATTAGTCDPGSTTYSGPVNVATSQTLNAIATQVGKSNSVIATASYVINLPVAVAPVFSPTPGNYASGQAVTMSSTTPSSSIYFTQDGTTPTFPVTGTTQLYTGFIGITTSTTFKALTVATGFTNSSVSTGAYVLSPGASITVTVKGGKVTVKGSGTAK